MYIDFLDKLLDIITPLLGTLVGGILAFWGTHWKTKQELKDKRRDERRKYAADISEVMADLQLVVARDTTIPFPSSKEERQRCRESIGVAHEKALFTLCQYTYCLPDNTRCKIQDFLDATYQNIKNWQARLNFDDNREDDILKVANQEACQYELPHVDQHKGEAYKAFVAMNDALKKYVEKNR